MNVEKVKISIKKLEALDVSNYSKEKLAVRDHVLLTHKRNLLSIEIKECGYIISGIGVSKPGDPICCETMSGLMEELEEELQDDV